MDIVDFPFIKAGEAKARPALFIRLISPETGLFQDTTGYIDTGATDCCVPIGYGAILGLNPHSGQPTEVRTANGKSTAYAHKCVIKVWDTQEFLKDNKILAYTAQNVRVLFMPDLTEILLGVNFLDEMELKINYSSRVFSLVKPV